MNQSLPPWEFAEGDNTVNGDDELVRYFGNVRPGENNFADVVAIDGEIVHLIEAIEQWRRIRRHLVKRLRRLRRRRDERARTNGGGT